MGNQTLTLQFLGATRTVTGSKTLVSAGFNLDDRLLIDCGLFQGPKEFRLRNRMDFPVDPTTIGAVAITHAHLDHCGYLPRLVKAGFKGPIYCTPASADLMRILLMDAAHLQEEEADYANQKGFSKHHPALPLYDSSDVEETLDQIRSVEKHQPVGIGNRLEICFYEAGHILGSSMIHLNYTRNSHNLHLLFSGDLGRYGMPLLKEPENPSPVDYLILESTYGNRLHCNCDTQADLAEIITQSIERGGVLVIPSFAIGRTQHLLFAIAQLKAEAAIPNVPVYLDSPMAIEVMRTYMHHFERLDIEARYQKEKGNVSFAPQNFHIAASREESKRLNDIGSNAIIVSASGMVTGGRILHHMVHRLPHARNTVLFIGYQAEGTRGRTIVEKAPEVKIHGQMVPVKAHVEMIDGMSAHADQDEMLTWLSRFDPVPSAVFLNHGESPVIDSFGEIISAKHHIAIHIPDYQDTFKLE